MVAEAAGLAISGMSSSISQVLWLCRVLWKCMPSWIGPVRVVGLPLTAGRHTRRDMAERRSQAPRAPRAPQNTVSGSWLSHTSWSRSMRNGGRECPGWRQLISGVRGKAGH